jgi:hypothetical protein
MGLIIGFSLKDGLLLYDSNRLIVPEMDDVQTDFVRKANNQSSTAHPGLKKTLKLLVAGHYWENLRIFMQQFISNCHSCRRSHMNHDKAPRPLHPLRIPAHPRQRIYMDN